MGVLKYLLCHSQASKSKRVEHNYSHACPEDTQTAVDDESFQGPLFPVHDGSSTGGTLVGESDANEPNIEEYDRVRTSRSLGPARLLLAPF